MGRTRSAGLRKRNGIWHINGKRIKGYGALFESTGTGDLEEAERYLNRRLEQIRQQVVYGVRPRRFFAEAAAKYLEEDCPPDSLDDNARHLAHAVKLIGALPLDHVHDETLKPFVADCRKRGNKGKTINIKLAVVRRVLNLAARKYRDKLTGHTWLETPPLISMLDTSDSRPPYPLGWNEQALLFPLLPEHLAAMALYDVNTGLREQELCGLRWEWEVAVEELGVSVFVLPDSKNDLPRVVVHNAVAQSVIEAQRGKHAEFVFCWRKGPKGQWRPTRSINNTAWLAARAQAAALYRERIGKPCPAGFATLHVHDLRHTFGRRLRAAGVAHETRQDLLGHKNGNVTTHYSAAELKELIDAVKLIEPRDGRSGPTLTLIRTA